MAQKRQLPPTIATLRPQDHLTSAATMCREMACGSGPTNGGGGWDRKI
jgi:hypothetical protein